VPSWVIRHEASLIVRLAPAILFGLLTIATLGLLGYGWLTYALGTGYHANFMQGNYGTAYLRFAMLAVLANWLLAAVASWRSGLQLKSQAIACAGLLCIAGAFLAAYNIPRDFRAEHVIGQQKYLIPWRYDPRAGYAEPGLQPIIIAVSYPDFIAQYESKNSPDNGLELSKRIDAENMRTGTPLDDSCAAGVCVGLARDENYFFVEEGFVYSIHYQGRGDVTFSGQAEVSAFRQRVIDLFDSFKAT
jgi:hypothetical protein